MNIFNIMLMFRIRLVTFFFFCKTMEIKMSAFSFKGGANTAKLYKYKLSEPPFLLLQCWQFFSPLTVGAVTSFSDLFLHFFCFAFSHSGCVDLSGVGVWVMVICVFILLYLFITVSADFVHHSVRF